MMTLKDKKVWVLWQKRQVPGSDRFTKIPLQKNGKGASSTNPDHWLSYEDAQNTLKSNGKFTGVGFTISKEFPILAIDLDHCVKDGELTRENFQMLFDMADTYTELSPSGDGLHIIFHIEEHFSLKKNKNVHDDGTAAEAYTEGRYFTYTGTPFGEEKAIRTIKQDEAEELLNILGLKIRYDTTIPEDHSNQTIEVNDNMTDKGLLREMFKGKGGTDRKKLYDGDTSAYNDDGSSADMALLMHLAFWTAKDSKRMEKLWLESPLGQREKTQTRFDYRIRSIENAIAKTTDVYQAAKPMSKSIISDTAKIKPTLSNEVEFQRNEKGYPFISAANIFEILKADTYLNDAFRLNTFSGQVESTIRGTGDWLPVQKFDIIELTVYLQQTYRFFEKVPQGLVHEGILKYANTNQVNPPQDLINSVGWDNEDRLEKWLMKVFKVEDNEVNALFGELWIKGLVSRIMKPGCKFDHVLVLEGSQGVGKSRALRALAQPWYAETTMDIDSKDFQLILTQNILIELSEGATLSRSSQNAMKQKITEQEDNFRRPYAESPEKVPRHCVFSMTTNEDQYLKDATGARRWFPVEIPDGAKADVAWLEENRLQMFAEAWHKVNVLGEKIYLDEDEVEVVKEIQNSKTEVDPWIERIAAWYFDSMQASRREDGVTTTECYDEALSDFTNREYTSGQGKRIAQIFRSNFKLSKNKSMSTLNGVRAFRFMPTSETEDILKVRGIEMKLNFSETQRSEEVKGGIRNKNWHQDFQLSKDDDDE